jgi:DNA-binding NarL/FixJ family response regulator
MTRVLVVSAGGPGFADLVRSGAHTVGQRSPLDVRPGDLAGPDVIVLHTRSAMRELAMLATLPAPRPPVLVVTNAIAPGAVLTALRSGARSILVEGQYTRADLLEAVRATAAGHSRLSPGPLSALVDHVQRLPSTPGHLGQPLTEGEFDVMELVAAGEPNAAIAERLGLAEKTVRNRVSQIYLKLQVGNRAEAIAHWVGRTRRPPE